MSYIRAQKVDIEEGQASRDGAVHLELPDHDEVLEPQLTLDMNLDDEVLSFVTQLIDAIDALPEGEALVVWKVIF
jgi:hypothetical protein